MARKTRIKDIAQMAGVSAGTVDRVLHNRGNVSSSALEAVEEVLKQVGYKPNIHLAGISMKRHYTIVVAMPEFKTGEYWERAYMGIERALQVYESIQIDSLYKHYNQYDLYACRSLFERILEMEFDGLIISPTFRDETFYLVSRLEERNIPYVYIDSTIDGTSPLACYTADLYTSGYLMGKLIDLTTPHDAEYVLFQAIRVGDASANTTVMRKRGFMDYFSEHNLVPRLHRASFSVLDEALNEKLIGNFFELHPEVRGATVLSSRVSVIAAYLRKHHIRGVKLIGLDLTDDNMRDVERGDIDFILGQRPAQQGYMAVKTLIHYLIYGRVADKTSSMPLDIITRENLSLYHEFIDTSDIKGL